MKSQSAKAKGRRAVQELRSRILEAFPELHPDDIAVKATAMPGEDLWLSPRARERFPFAIEVKNVEKLNIWEALAQAESHAEGTGLAPLLAFRRNRSDFFVAFRLEDLFKRRLE